MSEGLCRVKMCGLSRSEDIEAVNALLPDYIGFVFWEKSRRFVSDEKAAGLKKQLDGRIQAVGVFLDDAIDHIADLAENGVIDLIQLHGHEDEDYIKLLRQRTKLPVIQAFVVKDESAAKLAENSTADYILLDAGYGTGQTFDWELLSDIKRPYFLAGGLDPDNVAGAISRLKPFAVDVSSGIETDGQKDPVKMKAFMSNITKES